MKYLITAHTDVGIWKDTNQDSLLAVKAAYYDQEIVFAVVCDGMGGLDKGEVASASVIQAYLRWFEKDFPETLRKGFEKRALFKTWENIATEMNSKIGAYGDEKSLTLGTTITAMLFYGSDYYIMNVGDSRAYKISEKTTVLTKDHTFVQREYEKGRMTYEETLNHPQRNVLLQCIGASETVEPDFFVGRVNPCEVYLICSDGFRHIITEEEMREYFDPEKCNTEGILRQSAQALTELNMQRKETDNISVVVVRSE